MPPFFLPPVARGNSFRENRPPWTPLEKLLIRCREISTNC